MDPFFSTSSGHLFFFCHHIPAASMASTIVHSPCSGRYCRCKFSLMSSSVASGSRRVVPWPPESFPECNNRIGRQMIDESLLQRMKILSGTQPSMVKIFFPGLEGQHEQLLIARPSTITVQAPQFASSQPILAPVRPRFSRRTSKRVFQGPQDLGSFPIHSPGPPLWPRLTGSALGPIRPPSP